MSPRKCLNWLEAMRMAAPAVKPTTTEWEIKLTRVPNRARPMTSWINPTIMVSVRASCTYSGLPGAAWMLSEEKRTMEAAVVGPETSSQDEPKSAATMAGTMPAYKPYSGGMPAMVAKATPWGRATMAPVMPAMRSARKLLAVTRGHHFRKGRK